MKDFGFVLATKMLVDNRRRVRFMYREETSNQQDSGWRFFCGDEDDKYVNNPDNIAIYNINTILDIDDRVSSLLDCPAEIAFESADGKSAFVVSKIVRNIAHIPNHF